jgi:mannose-6-phosphate isomerase-like protein (cupin superfamily)
MENTKVNVAEKFGLFNKQWTPHIIGELNGQQIKLAKISGEFVWHSHEHEDEMFLIFKGTLYMDFRDRTEVLKEGDMIIVPKGVEHNPRTKDGEEVWLMLCEPAETLHTGAVEDERTNNNQQWI